MSSDNILLCKYDDIRPYMVEILKEINLYKRLELYEELYKRVHIGYKPFVAFHIKRTQDKINKQDINSFIF